MHSFVPDPDFRIAFSDLPRRLMGKLGECEFHAARRQHRDQLTKSLSKCFRPRNNPSPLEIPLFDDVVSPFYFDS